MVGSVRVNMACECDTNIVELHTGALSTVINLFLFVHNGNDEIHVVKVLIRRKFKVIWTIVFVIYFILTCTKRKRRELM